MTSEQAEIMLAQTVASLLNTCELNLDEVEDNTYFAICNARNVLDALGYCPGCGSYKTYCACIPIGGC